MGNFIYNVLLLILWMILMYEAWLCAAGPKLIVLYLRRFRLTTAQEVVTAALEQGLSKRYRVVTLDDASFPPMEVPRLYKRLSRYGGPVSWSVAMFVLVTIVTVLYGLTNPTITGMISGLALVGFVVFGGILFVIFFSAMVVLFTALLLLQRWRVRKHARLAVQTSDDVDRVEATIADLGRWSKRSTLLAPRATIITVTDDLWRKVVAGLVQRANVVLVDISVSTDNLQWELALLEGRSFQHTVFVANREAESVMNQPAGHACILYETFSKRGDRNVFLSALTQALDERAMGPPPFDSREFILRPAATCLRMLTVLVLTMLLAIHVVGTVLALVGDIAK
jgi:hypothetical protein